VTPREPRRSIGAQSAFPSGSRTVEEVDALAAGLVDRISGRLRKAGKVCRTITVGFRFDDFSRATRSHTLSGPTAQTEQILGAVRELLNAARPMIKERGLTLLGISLGNLESDEAVQMELPLSGDSEDRSALDAALDDVRSRFGADAIMRASLVDRDDVTVPLLPD